MAAARMMSSGQSACLSYPKARLAAQFESVQFGFVTSFDAMSAKLTV